MDSFSRTSFFLNLTLIFLLFISPSAQTTNSDYSLVYKYCANHSSTSSPSTILSPLLQELVEKSSESNFFETNTVNDNDNMAISGLFQCRGDLTTDECHNCIKQLPKMSHNLCGGKIPARIQLSGCYIHYEPDGILTAATSRVEMLYKICSKAVAVWNGFSGVRHAAFEALLRGVMSGNGFCDMKYETMRVMGQCEGKMGDCECGECVSNAVQIAQDECGYSVSGKVYLQNCFVSYSYNSDKSYREEGKGGNSGKLVAIVLGGAAALSFGFFVLIFIRSIGKKRDDW